MELFFLFLLLYFPCSCFSLSIIFFGGEILRLRNSSIANGSETKWSCSMDFVSCAGDKVSIHAHNKLSFSMGHEPVPTIQLQ